MDKTWSFDRQWAMRDSNPRHPACKAGALDAVLWRGHAHAEIQPNMLQSRRRRPDARKKVVSRLYPSATDDWMSTTRPAHGADIRLSTQPLGSSTNTSGIVPLAAYRLPGRQVRLYRLTTAST